ncbi:arginine--tRNA ligase [Bacillus sp. FJAT-49736]|uniref:arginine--tRNA ligase n=1 Tax=Bacillus sp. FJAT-49736 TaxID=2833582 RepID=UPI001BC955FE|nr:arginine--tRNA ligase [Bacillus sp. FJAT-49736]MBS4175462.1 arginine--tRNA ligase [Bacillus sp. FJAT-49736]
MDLKVIFAKKLNDSNTELGTIESIYNLIEVPKNPTHGDLAFPCFQLAKNLRKSPAEIAAELSRKLEKDTGFSKVNPIGPYINVFFSSEKIGKVVVGQVLKAGHDYGDSSIGENKTVVLDMSSPNIARPFSMGHLRSTVIGNALANLAEKTGYQTVKINHVGDWGTQFGKLITAYKKWGDQQTVKENPIKELSKLYVQFHEEAKVNPVLEAEARAAFKSLEDGDEENLQLWKWFRAESLKAFMKIYDLIGITFDSYNGEAFYNDKMEEVVDLLKDRNLLEHSDGAEVVTLDKSQLPPCLIKKSDGATLYATRDLAAAIYRQRTYQFDTALYVVGQEQTVHFKQVKGVLEKLGFTWATNMHHIPFGLYLKDGKRMSTRKGRVILLEEVLREAILLAEKNISDKNPSLVNAADVAEAVGVGAIVFHDLKNDRMNNIEFSLKDMLTFEGETGPYVQYTYARATSILRKAAIDQYEFAALQDQESWEIIKLLNQFPETIESAYARFAPSVLAKYLIHLSQAFNKYYAKVRIIQKDTELLSRLSLVKAVTIVLKEGLRILGIKAPEEM